MNKLILEFTEFNNMRLNKETVVNAMAVDNKALSIDAFDKHQDMIRQAIAKITDIGTSMQSSSSFKVLKSKLSLEDQDISNLKIVKIVKSTSMRYDVYISFVISDIEYWGVVNDIISNPELKSEVFKDDSLIQTREWVIKIKGLLIKSIRNWLKPQFGKFKLLNDEVICYSNKTGKLLRLPKDSIIEVLKAYNDKIIFEYMNDQYTLTNDNFIYFNWWFEKID